MDLLKLILTTCPAHISLNYIEDAGDIILVVDVNFDGWRGVLMHLIKKKRHLLQYKSEIWFNAKRNYDAMK